MIVRDMCLADNAFSAWMDSMTCRRRILMAAAPVTAIPLGLWMETLPVTKIQASACVKRTLLVRVMHKFTVTSLFPSGKKKSLYLIS